MHRPAFPYKWKFKFAGCANDCVAVDRPGSDCSIIGTWRDDIRVDQAAVKAYVAGELAGNGIFQRYGTKCSGHPDRGL